MKHLLNLSLFGVLALFFAACTGNSTQQGDGNDSDSVAVVTVPDTAVYGIIDESTTMHMLTIILEDGKTKSFSMNLDSLLGKWTSLARNFQIMENGVVESNATAETNPYTQWQMSNAQIILNTDTFDVLSLGADSLALENSKGIFVYKRQR